MTIKVGAAHIDERGRASGGQSGDQTGRELSIKPGYIYNDGWDYCIRIKSLSKRKKFKEFIKWACGSKYIGYDQGQRLSLYNELKRIGFNNYMLLNKNVECDCSSLVACGLIVAGFTKISPKATTHYNKDIDTALSLMKTMKKNYPNSFTYFDSKYKNGNHTKVSTWWRNGDILLKQGNHVETVVSGGRKIIKKASYYAQYRGASIKIDDVLKDIGASPNRYGSVSKRKPIAKANGIVNYKGTAKQNLKMVSLAKKGKLKRA